jgi:hypothetical protein
MPEFVDEENQTLILLPKIHEAHVEATDTGRKQDFES